MPDELREKYQDIKLACGEWIAPALEETESGPLCVEQSRYERQDDLLPGSRTIHGAIPIVGKFNGICSLFLAGRPD